MVRDNGEAAMERELAEIRQRGLAAIAGARHQPDLERIEREYLGRTGSLADVRKRLAGLSAGDRPRLGQLANDIRTLLAQAVADRRRSFGQPTRRLDPHLPGRVVPHGHLHPLTKFSRRMLTAWRSLGFDVHEGPELEHQWFNFESLNIPPDHPARDIQDTFFIDDHPALVLRTHISTVQLRSLKHRRPPLRFVEIGRAYRHEATDATHESMYFECEGLVIDRGLTMAHLVTTLKAFFALLFDRDVPVRVRPSYFPFVEPGIEMDMQWTKNGKSTWLEILGAGMIHPNVLKAMKLDPAQWSGFAWGIGVDRLLMLEQGIPDVRLSYGGDLEFLKQF